MKVDKYMAISKISQIVKLNGNFKNSINLYLNLNKKEKIESYIPTKSSLNVLKRYMNSVKQNKNHSTILIGSYGKGKSHLLLILLAITSMERSKENDSVVRMLLKKMQSVDIDAYHLAKDVWKNKGRFLPVIISGCQEDVSRSFMIALNDALKREKVADLMPDTFFSIARETVARWKTEYPAVYESYEKALQEKGTSAKEIENGLKVCNPERLELFREIYPSLMGGEQFNPLTGSEVLPMYQSVADKLREEYGYSGIYIVFDEFSKFIEGQEKHAIGGNMKFLQDMCELANESKETQIYMTMVAHKSIKEYGAYLQEAVINAFIGIEGRLEEVIFNTSFKNSYELIQNAIETDTNKLAEIPDSSKFFGKEKVEEYYKIPAFRTAFTSKDFEDIIVKGCYPLNPISAYALLNISEKVAQNERTLFTFISKEEPNSMAQYVSDHTLRDEWIVTPDRVYDYFQNMFKKEKGNERVHIEWLNAEYAISKVKEPDKIRMLKTLAVLNIINKFDEMPPTEEILKIASGLPDAVEILSSLVSKELIYKKEATNCYVFKTRAGIALKSEIKKRRALKDTPNLPKVFNLINNTQYILPKRYNNEYSMTRYFRYEYLDVEDFLQIDNMNVYLEDGKFQDGKVMALYSLKNVDRTKEIQNKVETAGIENIVLIYAKTPFILLNKAIEYEVLQDIKADAKFMKENEILSKELSVMEEDIVNILSDFLEDEFGDVKSRVIFYYDGQNWVFDENITISAAVDAVCDYFYSETVVINNELINKQFIKTAPIKKSRKTIMENIMNKSSDEYYRTGTSAESTIYRAVMVNSEILSKDKPQKVQHLLEMFEEFFDGCVEEKRSLSILVNQYSARPYGMRAGVLPILLAHILSQKKEDIIVYYGDRETELTVDSIINMVDYPDKYSVFISKDSADKDRYLRALSELFADKADYNLSGNRIANILTCMQRWYRALPQVTKNIRRENEYISDKQILKALPRLKNVMQRMDVNAYEAILETLPEICGGVGYEETIRLLRTMKVTLNGYMDWLLSRVAEDTRNIFSSDKKDDLIHTLKNWYENQSDVAKHGLYNAAVSGFMSCIADIDTFDEYSVVLKLIKIVTEIHADSWNDDSYAEYIEKLKGIKTEIEAIGDETKRENCVLTFTGKNGVTIQKYYAPVDLDDGAVFRNILEDQLESFSDLDVNVRVAILLEMIEKVMRKEE